jgi:site-specific recombinase XerD
LLGDFERRLAEQDLSPVTARGYRHDLDRFRRWIEERRSRLRSLVRNTLALDLRHSAAEVWLLGPAAGDLDRNNVLVRR